MDEQKEVCVGWVNEPCSICTRWRVTWKDGYLFADGVRLTGGTERRTLATSTEFLLMLYGAESLDLRLTCVALRAICARRGGVNAAGMDDCWCRHE